MTSKKAKIDTELLMWKKQISRIMSTIESLPPEKKVKFMAVSVDLNMLATEFDNKINRLNKSGHNVCE